jgi:hypothetical protein
MVNAFQIVLDEVNAQVGGFTMVYQDLDDGTPSAAPGTPARKPPTPARPSLIRT